MSKHYENDLDIPFLLFAGITLGFVGMILYLLFTTTKSSEPQTYSCTYQEVVSLNLWKETEGSFFLWIWGFKDDPKYYFYTKNEKWMLMLEDKEATAVYLKESDEEKPNFKYCTWSWAESIFWDEILTVPTNTVKKEFNVDFNK